MSDTFELMGGTYRRPRAGELDVEGLRVLCSLVAGRHAELQAILADEAPTEEHVDAAARATRFIESALSRIERVLVRFSDACHEDGMDVREALDAAGASRPAATIDAAVGLMEAIGVGGSRLPKS